MHNPSNSYAELFAESTLNAAALQAVPAATRVTAGILSLEIGHNGRNPLNSEHHLSRKTEIPLPLQPTEDQLPANIPSQASRTQFTNSP